MENDNYFLESDKYETPEWVLKEIVKEIKFDEKDVIWCPFHGPTGQSENFLKKMGLNICNSGVDFFDPPPNECTMILDNPPFSMKERIVDRILEINKPAIIILPLLCIRTKWMKEALLKHKSQLTLAIPSKRINFDLKGKPTYWATFETAWFCFNCQDKFWNENPIKYL